MASTSNKGERNARIDLTHYSRITREDLDQIENHANEIVTSNLQIEKFVLIDQMQTQNSD